MLDELIEELLETTEKMSIHDTEEADYMFLQLINGSKQCVLNEYDALYAMLFILRLALIKKFKPKVISPGDEHPYGLIPFVTEHFGISYCDN